MRLLAVFALTAACAGSPSVPALPGPPLSRGEYILRGITDDQYLALEQVDTHYVYLLLPGGGTPALAGIADRVHALGKAVFLYTDDGGLTVWTAAHGPVVLSQEAYFIAPVLSADGETTMLVEQDENAALLAVRLDGSDRRVIVENYGVNDPAALPFGSSLLFYGESGVALFDPASGAVTPVAGDTILDVHGDSAAVADGHYQGLFVDATGAATVFDQGVSGGRFAPDGSFIYLGADSLQRVRPGEAPLTLAPLPQGAFVSLDALSPDGETALLDYGDNRLLSASTSTPTPLRTLVTSADGVDASSYPPFTADSRSILYLTTRPPFPGMPSALPPGWQLDRSPAQGGASRRIEEYPSVFVPTHGSHLLLLADCGIDTCQLHAADAGSGETAPIADHVRSFWFRGDLTCFTVTGTANDDGAYCRNTP